MPTEEIVYLNQPAAEPEPIYDPTGVTDTYIEPVLQGLNFISQYRCMLRVYAYSAIV